ncbi:MAG: phage holin family protein [Sediminibacterium sp.]|nr:phage holin family protein [Sediminibacterium sp.]
MKFLIRIGVTALSVLILQHFLKGVEVSNWTVSIMVAVVLAFLNTIVKPILQVLSIPITVLTLGFFLLVINAGIIMLADYLIDGFHVSGFWKALLFSILLSIVSGILNVILGVSKNEED